MKLAACLVRLIFLGMVSSIALAQGSPDTNCVPVPKAMSQYTGVWYKEAKVQRDRTVLLCGKLPLSETRLAGASATFMQQGFSVRLLEPNSGATLEFLDLDRDGKIAERQQRQLLLRGEYGWIYTTRKWFYAPQHHPACAEVSVEPYFKDVPQQPPVELPSSATTDQLIAVSLVRIITHGPRTYLIAAALYDAQGSLRSLSFGITKDGEWLHANYTPEDLKQFPFGSTLGIDAPSAREFFGIPAKFSVTAYLSSSTPTLPTRSTFRDVVSLHYANNIVRTQESSDGHWNQPRYLGYKTTIADRALGMRESRECGPPITPGLTKPTR